MGAGFKTYADLKIEKTVYEFMCTYIWRIKPNAKWKKLLKNNPGSPFFCLVTPSDIAYILAIIKNGKDTWDQEKRLENDLEADPEKKAKMLFSVGEGRKGEICKSVWNNDGLEFYYMVEKIGERCTIPRNYFWHLSMGGQIGSQERRGERIQSGHTGLQMMEKLRGERRMIVLVRSLGGKLKMKDTKLDLDLKAECVWDKDTVRKVYRKVGEEYNEDDKLHNYDDIVSSHEDGNEMKGDEKEGGEEMELETENTVEGNEKVEPI